MPSISGKAGEVLVVIENADWNAELGEEVRSVLEDEYPYLPLIEPLYSLIHVSHGGFVEMFQVHRNIIFFDINPQVQKTGLTLVRDKWSAPQTIINIAAYTAEDAKAIFEENKDLIIRTLEQAERDRVVRNTYLYENATYTAKCQRCSVAPFTHLPDISCASFRATSRG